MRASAGSRSLQGSRLAAAGLLATGALACSSLGGPGASSGSDAGGPTVATVNGRQITEGELDAWIKEDFFQREFISVPESKRFELRSSAADRMVSELILEEEARSRGLSTDEVLQAEVQALGPVTDAEVAAFWEQNRQRIPGGGDLETWTPRIREHLGKQREAQARRVLRARSEVSIQLSPPRIEISADGPARGPADAPVTIIAFSDYQCPYCQRAEPTIQALLERYPQQVRFVYRHLPLDSIHPRARAAAEAAVCAEEQGRFWEFHERVFANPKALSEADLARYASELGLDGEAFQACSQLPDTRARVQSDVQAAGKAGISGTPAFLVNGILLTGARPLEDFVRVIEQELGRAEAGRS